MLVKYPYNSLRALIFLISGISILFSCKPENYSDQNKAKAHNSLRKKETGQYQSAVFPAILHSVSSGNLITRMGCDVTSMLMAGLNQKDNSFSHCGIVIIENDSPFVYHCIGGEFNPDQKMKREPLFEFAQPGASKGIGVFEPQLSDPEKTRLISTVKGWFDAGLPFDLDFNLQTDQRMYCSEMVAKALARATENKWQPEVRKLNGMEFIAIENTYLNHAMVEKLRIAY